MTMYGGIAAAGLVLMASGPAAAQTEPRASADLRPASGGQVGGRLTFLGIGGGTGADRIRVTGEVTGLTPGPKGFHVHDRGDCSAPDATSAGPHYNPYGKKHGGPGNPERHAGDLGNIVADASGRAVVDLEIEGLAVSREQPGGIVGRAVIVHAQADDERTDPTGNSGARIACGVIGN